MVLRYAPLRLAADERIVFTQRGYFPIGTTAPVALVFGISVLVAIATFAVQAAHFSSRPLGKGPIERQKRFSQMFVTNLLAIPPSRQ